MSLRTEDDYALQSQSIPLTVLTWPWVSVLVEDNEVCLLMQEEFGSDCCKMVIFFPDQSVKIELL